MAQTLTLSIRKHTTTTISRLEVTFTYRVQIVRSYKRVYGEDHDECFINKHAVYI